MNKIKAALLTATMNKKLLNILIDDLSVLIKDMEEYIEDQRSQVSSEESGLFDQLDDESYDDDNDYDVDSLIAEAEERIWTNDNNFQSFVDSQGWKILESVGIEDLYDVDSRASGAINDGKHPEPDENNPFPMWDVALNALEEVVEALKKMLKSGKSISFKASMPPTMNKKLEAIDKDFIDTLIRDLSNYVDDLDAEVTRASRKADRLNDDEFLEKVLEFDDLILEESDSYYQEFIDSEGQEILDSLGIDDINDLDSRIVDAIESDALPTRDNPFAVWITQVNALNEVINWLKARNRELAGK